MGFLEFLTLLFVALKLMGYIDWGWLVVFSPIILAISIYVAIFIGYVVTHIRSK